MDVLNAGDGVVDVGSVVGNSRDAGHGNLEELHHFVLRRAILDELSVEHLRGPFFADNGLNPPGKVDAVVAHQNLVRWLPR